jgi:type IV secretion system protein TrbL
MLGALFTIHLVFFSMPASSQVAIVPNGQTISSPSDIVAVYENLVGQWISMLQSYAAELFWALAFLDMSWFAIEVVTKYRLNMTLALIMTVNKILVIGFFLALLMNATTWIPMIVNTFPQLGQLASGISAIAPSEILKMGVVLAGKLLYAAGKTSLLVNIATALVLVISAIGILAGFAWLTLQFVVAKIETALAIGLGFIFVAFGGSRWTVPYVERYWTFAVTAGIKMMSFYMLLGAGMAVAQNWINQASNLSFLSLDIDTAFTILGGLIVYCGVVYSCTKLASSVLGGSPALSGADVMAALSAGAAAGAVAATAGAATLTTAGVGAAAGAGAQVTPNTSASSPNPPPQPHAPSSGGNGAGGLQKAATMANAAARMASNFSGGGHSPNPPRFGGFSHGE